MCVFSAGNCCHESRASANAPRHPEPSESAERLAAADFARHLSHHFVVDRRQDGAGERGLNC